MLSYATWVNFLSVSGQKHNCEVKKYSHVDIDAYCFERELKQKKKSDSYCIDRFDLDIKQLVRPSAVRTVKTRD